MNLTKLHLDEKIKLRQIVDQACTTTYDAAKVNILSY